MDDRLKALMNELRVLAGQRSAGSDASVELFESKIYEYLADLRKADERYFAELSDSDNGESVYFDNEFIEASNDQEAIGKAGEWASKS